MLEGKNNKFSVSSDGILHFKERVRIPKNEEMRNQLLLETRGTPYSIHPRANKMYKDLKEQLWWFRIKKDVAKYA